MHDIDFGDMCSARILFDEMLRENVFWWFGNVALDISIRDKLLEFEPNCVGHKNVVWWNARENVFALATKMVSKIYERQILLGDSKHFHRIHGWSGCMYWLL